MSPLATKDAPKTVEEVEKLLSNDTKVKVAGVDVDGVLRGKVMSKEKFLGAIKYGFGFSSALFGWDMHDINYTRELLIANEANGFRDLTAIIDLSTYRRLSWEENVPFFLIRFLDSDTREPISVDPRSVLELVCEKARSKGWKCVAGAELEYYQFLETPQTIAQKHFSNLNPLTPGNHGYSLLRPTYNHKYFYELYDEARAFGIEVEGHHTETGPGVYETALAYTEASRMADNTVLYKLLAKSIGMKYGIMPTFMAKPYSDMAGCSGHIHVSLQGVSGKNLFSVSDDELKDGGRKTASHEQLRFISQQAEWFLAGIISGLSDVTVMMCPTINSYKRLLGGSAMWAPDTATYGYESRKASIRIVSPPSCPPAATRFEIRVPGADMNTHYALSAIFALGLRGIELRLPIPYGPLGTDGVTRETVQHLPTDLQSATSAFAKPESLARELFGDLFVDHVAGSREHELGTFKKAVTNWEGEFTPFIRWY
ncbi:hypothetical protein BCR39DRAFT_464260 [Naematelia encephala]|uniref:Glutamine synthetase n=1 Tax=Naematelia encephala TaxID=71784 RepID=A0A1Y2BDV3_9TREE|nr:hypothetical protein BCR39DRAFT_464260 [Naematelia encephala]